MYGIELTVLLPLFAGMSVHAERPLFPADVAAVLSQPARPRVLVSTPLHLRALAESGLEFPDLDLIVSATAPLDSGADEDHRGRSLRAPLLEMFGSTETCVFATRRTAQQDVWRLYDGITLEPGAESTLVSAPWYERPQQLQDVLELRGADGFVAAGSQLGPGRSRGQTRLTGRHHAAAVCRPGRRRCRGLSAGRRCVRRRQSRCGRGRSQPRRQRTRYRQPAGREPGCRVHAAAAGAGGSHPARRRWARCLARSCWSSHAARVATSGSRSARCVSAACRQSSSTSRSARHTSPEQHQERRPAGNRSRNCVRRTADHRCCVDRP